MSGGSNKGGRFVLKHSHGGHSHGGHSHGGHSHSHPDPEEHGHGVPVEAGFVASERAQSTQRPFLEKDAGRGKVLFLDLPSGIAGDMTLAALFDLGVPPPVVSDAIRRLGLEDVRLVVESGYVGAIGCSHVSVEWREQDKERSFVEIEQMILGSSLEEEVQELALRIFRRLAEAEADVHRTTLEHVHFHEVGAVDAIVDIVGSAAALCYLGAEVKSSPVPLGRGFVECRHGRLPLPAPATLLCLVGVPTVDSGLDVELVTPTGAAIVATVSSEFGSWFSMIPSRIGWGAGTRGLSDRPNAMRAVLGTPTSELAGAVSHVLLEANIDDMTGEVAAHALERCLASGAVDAWIASVTMKKGRPGMVFSALAPLHQATRVTDVILRETSTIGVRQMAVSRTELGRTVRTVETPWGPVRLKTSGAGTSSLKEKPEIDDCLAIARQQDLPLRVILEEVLRLTKS